MQTTVDRPLNILFLESYAAGSHGRVIDLIKRYSKHNVQDVRLERGHWRWLALAGHHAMADIVNMRREASIPDVLLFSGPLNVPALLALLPQSFLGVPRIVFFHESQWSYPSRNEDSRPYLLQHLDTVSVCDEAWFNSRFHLNDFWHAAETQHSHPRMRALVRTIAERSRTRSRVVHPPVALDFPEDVPHRSTSRLIWNARWEADKRPDLLVKLLDTLPEGTVQQLTVLGTAGKSVADIRRELGRHAQYTNVPGHVPSRRDYEATLKESDVIISTAAHEFFGIAVLESVLAGSLAVLPRSLAYPETLPSAWFYRPNDVDDMARTVAAALCSPLRDMAMQSADANRFLAQRIVPQWDEHFRRIAGQRQLDR